MEYSTDVGSIVVYTIASIVYIGVCGCVGWFIGKKVGDCYYNSKKNR